MMIHVSRCFALLKTYTHGLGIRYQFQLVIGTICQVQFGIQYLYFIVYKFLNSTMSIEFDLTRIEAENISHRIEAENIIENEPH